MIARGAALVLEDLGGLVLFARHSYATLLATRPYMGEVVRQTFRITVGCLPLVLFVAMFIGANVVVQGYQVLRMLGAESLVGMFASMALVRELGPVLSAAMVSAKAGSEIASELATMRIRSQIDAIEMMGVDPVRFLVVPRVIGSIFAMPALTVVGLYAAIAMGWGVGVYQFGLNGSAFLEQIYTTSGLDDLGAAILKSIAFGGTLVVIQCFAGFEARQGPQGVGLATNKAVVAGAVAIGWINLVVSGALY